MAEDFTQEYVVSVWLAAQVPAAAFAALLEPIPDAAPDGPPPSRFAVEAGLGWYDADYLEACFEPENRPVAALLEGVSFGASFVEAVAQVAAQAGLAEANAAALLYDVAYLLDVELAAPAPLLRFIGAFPYEPEDGEP